MKKSLPTAAIVNELTGSSAFFRKPEQQKHASPSPLAQEKKPSKAKPTVPKKQIITTAPPQVPGEVNKKEDSKSDKDEARKSDSSQDNGLASYQASTIERIRKVVKDGGREVSFTRLSMEEKQQMKDLVYTYGRMGIKTTENEIVRIALNYILEDYQASGKASILERVLEALNA